MLKFCIMVNAQEWLDNNYLTEERNKITKLDVVCNSLEGELNLSEFTNLSEISITKNSKNWESFYQWIKANYSIIINNKTLYPNFTQNNNFMWFLLEGSLEFYVNKKTSEKYTWRWQDKFLPLEYDDNKNFYELFRGDGVNFYPGYVLKNDCAEENYTGKQKKVLSEYEHLLAEWRKTHFVSKSLLTIKVGQIEEKEKAIKKLNDKLNQRESELIVVQQELIKQKTQIQTLTEQVKKLTLDKLTTELEQDKKVLSNLLSNVQQNLNEINQEYLETLLEAQQEIVKGINNPFIAKQLEKAKNKLTSQLANEQIISLLNWQSKITKLELEIEQISAEQALEAQIEVAPPAYQQ